MVRLQVTQRRQERELNRRRTVRRVRAVLPRLTRWRRHQGRLARRRQVQNGAVAALFVLSQVVVWLLSGNWWLRAGALVFALLALPVLLTLTFDRRS